MQSSRKYTVGMIVGALVFSAPSFANQNFSAVTESFFENSAGSPLLPLLKSAKKSIDIEIYEMNDPLIIGAIQSAVASGLRVRIVQEETPVGAACKVFAPADGSDDASCALQKSLVKQVTEQGGKYVPFNQGELCGTKGSHCFQHGKMALIDQSQAMLSTGNFNTTSLCNKKEHPTNCNRDYSILSSDPAVVASLQTIFEKDLKAVAYDISAVLNASNDQKLTVSPLSMKPIIDFINTAKKTIQIQNQYLHDPTMNAAIIAATKRGVEVQLMVSSACSFGKPTPSETNQWNTIFTTFDQAGVKTRVFTRRIQVGGVSGYLHAKAILVDGKRAWVGSVNGSTMSLSNNREYGIFLNESVEVQKLASFLISDFQNPNSESWKDSLLCRNDPPPAPQSPIGDQFN